MSRLMNPKMDFQYVHDVPSLVPAYSFLSFKPGAFNTTQHVPVREFLSWLDRWLQVTSRSSAPAHSCPKLAVKAKPSWAMIDMNDTTQVNRPPMRSNHEHGV